MTEPDARTRLREAALDLFGRNGVRETSTRQVLTAAGLKNPSAINYHFGSKAELVDDLVGELIRGTAPVMQRQVELANASSRPNVEAWAAVAVDSAVDLISTERGCLLARLWADYDSAVQPHAFEAFLVSGNRVSTEWLEAVQKTFPDVPRYLAVARNVIMLRTLEWTIARRAGRTLSANPIQTLKMEDIAAFRRLLLEVSVGILAAPTTLAEDDITLG